jgi:protein-tyrosine phosphatase
MTKILMVCLGNICRSPLAEGILSHLDISNNFIVDSAGTSAYHMGELPDSRSIEIAQINGINISNQRSREFKISDFDYFDVIYAMDKSNFNNLLQLARNNSDKQKIKLILNEIHPNKNLDVPDPYYGGEDGFTKVFTMLKEACEVIISKYN